MSSDRNLVRLTLAFLSLKGVGPITTRQLLANISHDATDPEVIADGLSQLERKPRGFKGVTASQMEMAFLSADQRIDQCRELGVGIAVQGCSVFWAAVWTIPKPPAVLYYMGDIEAAVLPGVAVIGTREPTDYGYEFGQRIARQCCDSGFAVVSGLAVGCDTSAHEGALAANGRTIAVMAHGLDSVYPPANRGLAERIRESGGLLVSEYSPGTEIRPNQLVERDRLQAGLSRGVIVIETGIKGGTMHTVGFALEQGRVLAAVAHKPELQHEPKTFGNQSLIQDGKAIPLADREAVKVFLAGLLPSPPVEAEAQKGLFGQEV